MTRGRCSPGQSAILGLVCPPRATCGAQLQGLFAAAQWMAQDAGAQLAPEAQRDLQQDGHGDRLEAARQVRQPCQANRRRRHHRRRRRRPARCTHPCAAPSPQELNFWIQRASDVAATRPGAMEALQQMCSSLQRVDSSRCPLQLELLQGASAVL